VGGASDFGYPNRDRARRSPNTGYPLRVGYVRRNGDRLDSLDEIKERVAQRTREVATAAYQAGMIDGKIKNLGEMEKALRLITTDDGPEAA
jgi:hypothetical protein